MGDILTIGGREFTSRLFLGTGKFTSPEVMQTVLDAAGTEVVTVSVRRMDPDAPEPDLVEFIPRDRILLVPNTSGAESAEEAVHLARLARQAGHTSWVKLEVTPDPKWLMPDPVATLEATKVLVKEGFQVLPYIGADPVLAKQLEEVGAVTVMPLGSPIGTNHGLTAPDVLAIIVEQATVPVVVDAGLGAPSDAAKALEMGVDAVFVSTALATARAPVAMARGFRLGVEAGRAAHLANCETSAPLTGFLGETV